MVACCNLLVALLASFLLPCARCDALVRGIFKVESPLGSPVSGMSLMAADQPNTTVCTDAEGKAVLSLPASRDFVIHGSRAHYQDLYIIGNSGTAPEFNYTTYMGSRREAEVLARLIGVPYNSSRGYIVVGMDSLLDPTAGLAPSNLVPAIGATSNVSGISGSTPFVFVDGILPVSARTISAKSSSFVTYPNMEVNVGDASAVPPIGQRCVTSPGMTSQPLRVRAYPDAVTVVSFICQNVSTGAVLRT